MECWRLKSRGKRYRQHRESSCSNGAHFRAIFSPPPPTVQTSGETQASGRNKTQYLPTTVGYLQFTMTSACLPAPPKSLRFVGFCLAVHCLAQAFIFPTRSFSSLPRAAAPMTRRSAAFIELGEKTRGGGESNEEGGSLGDRSRGGGGGGGRATVITERAWNTSTLGALPSDLESLSSSVSRTQERAGGGGARGGAEGG